MQISGSAAYSGLSSIQSGQARVDQAAQSIANSNIDRTQSTQKQATSVNGIDRRQDTDQATDLVQLTTGKTQVQLGAKVEKASDEVLGTLLDIHA